MNVPVFIDISLEEQVRVSGSVSGSNESDAVPFLLQAKELRQYFNSLGAEISVERSAKGIEDDLHKIIGVCDACIKDPQAKEAQVEEVLNGIVSILALVEKSENLILAFCEKLSQAPANAIGMTCLKV